jgi:hypothetical protein
MVSALSLRSEVWIEELKVRQIEGFVGINGIKDAVGAQDLCSAE